MIGTDSRTGRTLASAAVLCVVAAVASVMYVAGAVPFVAHAAVGVVLAGVTWRMFAAPTQTKEADRNGSTQAEWRLSDTSPATPWPDVCVAVFDGIFGRRILTGRFVAACIATCLLAGHIGVLVIGQSHPAIVGEAGGLMLAVTVGMLLPTAVSLVKTRMVMTAMPRRRSTARVALLTAADLLLTLAIFLSLRWVVVRSISSRTKGLVEYSLWLLEEVFYPSPMDDTRGSEWVLFVGAALTSVWVWLYAASHGLSAVVAPFPRLRRRLDALAPDLSRPPRALGVVAVAAVVIVFFGVAPLVRLRRLTGA